MAIATSWQCNRASKQQLLKQWEILSYWCREEETSDRWWTRDLDVAISLTLFWLIEYNYSFSLLFYLFFLDRFGNGGVCKYHLRWRLKCKKKHFIYWFGPLHSCNINHVTPPSQMLEDPIYTYIAWKQSITWKSILVF